MHPALITVGCDTSITTVAADDGGRLPLLLLDGGSSDAFGNVDGGFAAAVERGSYFFACASVSDNNEPKPASVDANAFAKSDKMDADATAFVISGSSTNVVRANSSSHRFNIASKSSNVSFGGGFSDVVDVNADVDELLLVLLLAVGSASFPRKPSKETLFFFGLAVAVVVVD